MTERTTADTAMAGSADTGGRGESRLRLAPRLLLSAVRLTWTASPPQSLLSLMLITISAGSLFLQVLLISSVLSVVLKAGGSGSLGDAVPPVVLFAIVTAIGTIVSNISALQQQVLEELVARSITRRLLDVSAAVELSSYDRPAFHDQAERVQSDATLRAQVLVHGIVTFGADTLGIVAGTIAVLALAPVLTPVLLLSGVPLIFTSKLSGRLQFDFLAQQSPRVRQRKYLERVLTRREEAKEVRAFSLARPLRDRWEQNYATYLEEFQRHIGRRVRVAVLGSAAAALLSSGALLIAVLLVTRGQLSVASAGAAIVAVRLLGTRVVGASRGWSAIFESSMFLRDLADFLSHTGEPRPKADRPAESARRSFETLTVSDVHFTYPGASQPTLFGVSMELTRGQVIALVGENGSGKSTLAKLLASLYEPQKGSIQWDGVDTRKLDPASLRRRTAVIFQDFVRFQFTARSNIALGRPDEDADEIAVRDAARKADADGFLMSLPAGYDTILSKEYADGVDLSIGQWQRVALARAFIRDASLLILDEPSASLDPRAEDELFGRMRALAAGRTVLLISHRFSSVRMADRIFVLSEGRVVEEGRHAMLMRNGGLYADLFRIQASAYLEDGPSVQES